MMRNAMKNNNQRMIKKLQQVLFNLYDFQNGELKLNRKSQTVQDIKWGRA